MGNWDQGSTTRWRRTRLGVLIRDGYRCRMGDPTHPLGSGQPKSPGCTGGTRRHPETGRPLLQVHHVAGRGVTGDDPAWLVTSCESCNLGVGDPTTQDPAPRTMTNWSLG